MANIPTSVNSQLQDLTKNMTELVRAAVEQIIIDIVASGLATQSSKTDMLKIQTEIEKLHTRYSKELTDMKHNAGKVEVCANKFCSNPSNRILGRRRQLILVFYVMYFTPPFYLDIALRDLRVTLENEKKKAIADVKRQLAEEKAKAVEEAKKKQWCANCSREALFYCCWNTSYCGYQCQVCKLFLFSFLFLLFFQ